MQPTVDDLTASNGALERWFSLLKSLGAGFFSASQTFVAFFQIFYRSIARALTTSPDSNDCSLLISPYFSGSGRPQFFSGDFSQAVAAAVARNSVLVIYIHPNRSQHAESIISSVLTNSVFLDLVNESSTLVWATLASQYDAAALARRFLYCTEYPYLAITRPTSRQTHGALLEQPLVADSGPWEQLELVGSVEGRNPDVNRALELLIRAIERATEDATRDQTRQERLEEDRRIRLEQQREYQEAVLKDRQLEAERKELERQTQLLKQRELEQQQKAEEERRSRVASRQAAFFAYLQRDLEKILIDEFNKTSTELKENALNSANAVPTVLLKLKLPNGVTVEKRFSYSTPLSGVFAWIDALPYVWDGNNHSINAMLRNLADGIQFPFPIPSVMLHDLVNKDACREALFGVCHKSTLPITLPDEYALTIPFPFRKFQRPSDPTDLTSLQQLTITSDTVLLLSEHRLISNSSPVAQPPTDPKSSEDSSSDTDSG